MSLLHLSLWAIGAISVLSGQPLSYTLLPAEGARPSARVDGTIAYDSSERRLYLFGGRDNTARNDLWVYSLGERRWSEVRTSGALPPARFGHTLVFDTARRQLVLFGGQASGFFSDVWAFDPVRAAWRQLARDEAGPSRRYGHSAIYDPARNRMVISHGFTDAGRFDDTWAFDLGANTWRNLTPQGTRPLRRCLHHAVLDEAGGQMLLYGGCASGFGPCPLDDLWAFDLATNRWTERQATSRPAGREHYGISFDAARGRLVLFGGSGGGLLNDTWLYDPRANTWQRAAIAGEPPSPRSRHQSAYAADRGITFFFGGTTNQGLTQELWMLGAGFVSQGPAITEGGVRNAFSGAADVVSPGEIVSIYGERLGPIDGIAVGLDERTGQPLLSGPGVAVRFNGIPAGLLYVQANQLNVQVPAAVAGAPAAHVVVTVNGQESAAVTLPVAETHPGLHARVWDDDGAEITRENPARTGSTVRLYATGYGVAGAALTLRAGGVAAEVVSSTPLAGTVGILEIRVRIPELPAPGLYPLTLRAGGAESPEIQLWVR